MTVLFSMTVNTGSKSQGDSQAAETELIVDALDYVRRYVHGSHSQSGNILDRNNQSIGTYTYTPVASK